MEEKTGLLFVLGGQRESLAWKLAGLSERELRLPRTDTGTNLLGLVKHVATIEQGYLLGCLGRPPVEPTPWVEPGAETNADLYATAEQSREWVLDFYSRVAAAVDRAVTELPLDTPATVPWWPEGRSATTLHHLVVHVIAETARHTGQADILREQLDGATGYRPDNPNLPPEDRHWWQAYRERLQQLADGFGQD